MPAELSDALDLVAPGTDLRESIENIIRAHNGALIVITHPQKLERLGIISGGMKIGPAARRIPMAVPGVKRAWLK